jgi:DNA-binding MarR family transcriptional regulator
VEEPSTAPYAFGDLLGLARLAWVRQMSARLAALGHGPFHRGDSALLRLLAQGPVPVGRAGAVLGVTRQGARKIVDRLERRGYARTERDRADGRVLNVSLTPAGADYARAVAEVAEALDRELARRVDPSQLVAADAVLRASITDAGLADRAAALVPGPDRGVFEKHGTGRGV